MRVFSLMVCLLGLACSAADAQVVTVVPGGYVNPGLEKDFLVPHLRVWNGNGGWHALRDDAEEFAEMEVKDPPVDVNGNTAPKGHVVFEIDGEIFQSASTVMQVGPAPTYFFKIIEAPAAIPMRASHIYTVKNIRLFYEYETVTGVKFRLIGYFDPDLKVEITPTSGNGAGGGGQSGGNQ